MSTTPQTCVQCSELFQRTEFEDRIRAKLSIQALGETFTIPPPKLCPNCRAQRRWAFRNEDFVCSDSCESCNKSMMSIFPHQRPYSVWCHDCFGSDAWDGLDFGAAVSLEDSILAQVVALMGRVPQRSIAVSRSENCDYSSYVDSAQNCYQCFLCYESSDCLFSYYTMKGQNVVDCHRTEACEIGYSNIHCSNCYSVHFSDHCSGSSDSYFLSHCRNCRNCIGCVNLNNAEYCIFNERYSPEAFRNELARLGFSSRSGVAQFQQSFAQFRAPFPYPENHNEQCENVQGDYLKNCRNCFDCFDLTDCQDCRHCANFWNLTDCLDTATAQTELGYENISGLPGFQMLATWLCMQSNDCYYSRNLSSCAHCFGCAGLKNKKYCILNQQYGKEEYFLLLASILRKMLAEGELGEFFPITASPFPYNISLAQRYHPLDRSVVEESGGWWWDENTNSKVDFANAVRADSLPDSIEDVADDVLNKIILCSTTQRPFKIIRQELEFYRQHRLPLPRFAPAERRRARSQQVNPRKLYMRQCDCRTLAGNRCNQAFQSTYAPDSGKSVYCMACFQAAM